MAKNSKFVIADDHPLFLRGLADFLHQLGYNDIIQSHNGADALQKIVDHHPDFAVIDIQMPYLSGIEVAQKASDQSPDTRIILISYHKDPVIVKMAIELNVSAYILKEDALYELKNCLDELLKGNSYFSSKILGYSEKNIENDNYISFLTPTEKKILRLIGQEMTSKDIAKEYGVSIRTIEKHRSNIIEKLSLEGTPTSLIMWAKKNKTIL